MKRDAAIELLRRIGVRGVIELLLHPLLLPLYSLVAWLQGLWSARGLLDGQWGRYQGFQPVNAINALFYKTQLVNVDRYGLRGTSPLLGLGEYRLSNWFHHSILSLYIYATGGAATILLGTVAWVFMHAIWFWVIQWHWVLLVIAVVFMSSTAYLMAFVRQNYNILGWLWLPLGFFGVTTGQLGLAAVAWFAASLGSITAVFVAVPLVLVLAISAPNPYLLLTLVPALMKLALHIVPMWRAGTSRDAVGTMAKVIGLSQRAVRYRRPPIRVTGSGVYFVVQYSLATAVLWWSTGEVPVLVITAFVLVFVNQYLLRFADDQSVVIMFVSVMAATVMGLAWNLWALLALLLSANLIPAAFGGGAWRRLGSMVQLEHHAPFDHSDIEMAMREFLAVPSGSRVMLAFDDPHDAYENVFDGYRVALELPLYVATAKGIHLMPDWYAIAETNYPGSPDFWGRSPKRVLANARSWDAGYVIVYQDSGTELEPVWRETFEVVGEFDWGQWVDYLRGVPLWSTDRPPKWWLLKVVAPPDGNP